VFLEAYLGTYSKEMPIASMIVFEQLFFELKKNWEIYVFLV
jgi:hypothetical protein